MSGEASNRESGEWIKGNGTKGVKNMDSGLMCHSVPALLFQKLYSRGEM